MSVETVLNVVDSWVPRLVIAVIAATAMSAAIRPYSIAVAPALFFLRLRRNFRVGLLVAVFVYPAFSRNNPGSSNPGVKAEFLKFT